ncbi:MAG TPA: hypothetical protein VMY69_08845 [Phycisphaerae bacterium]|nr:hypothetical protein [Phycisphaerae bacterium]
MVWRRPVRRWRYSGWTRRRLEGRFSDDRPGQARLEAISSWGCSRAGSVSDSDPDGHRHGYAHGYAHGDRYGYADGYAYGDADGHADGHSDGHSDGHADGHTDGHTDGHADGHADGHTDGHADGHADSDTDRHSDSDGHAASEQRQGHALPQGQDQHRLGELGSVASAPRRFAGGMPLD